MAYLSPSARTLAAWCIALSLCGSPKPVTAQACGVAIGSTSECDALPDATTAPHPAIPSTLIGNPIDLASGNKYQQATDFASHRSMLQFRRHYASRNADTNVGLGNGWRGSYDTRLYKDVDGVLVILEASGHRTRFHPEHDIGKSSGAARSWRARTPTDGRIIHWNGAHIREFPDGRSVRYLGRWPSRIDYPDGQALRLSWRGGRLRSVTDDLGDILEFEYTPGHPGVGWYEEHPDGTQPGFLKRLILPDGREIRYRYDHRRNLKSAEFPGGAVRRYHYEREDLPAHVTGITEPSGVRDVQWHYDDAGSAVGHTDLIRNTTTRLSISRDADGGGTTRITDDTGAHATYRWRHDGTDDRFLLVAGTGIACGTCPRTGVEYRYSDDLLLEAEVFADGRVRSYSYDSRRRLRTILGPSGDIAELQYDDREYGPSAVRQSGIGAGPRSSVYSIAYPKLVAAPIGAAKPIVGRRHRLSATTRRVRNRACVAACVATGTAVGGVVGRGVGTTVGTAGGVIVGGGAGTILLPGGGTIGGGTIGGAAGGTAGGALGGAGGAAIGGSLGGLLSSILCSEEHDGEHAADARPVPGTWSPPPGSDGEEECARLKARVESTKARAAGLKGCKSGMSTPELVVRRSAWLEVATARSIFNQKCWAGGDVGHQRALAQAWQSIRNCDILMP